MDVQMLILLSKPLSVSEIVSSIHANDLTFYADNTAREGGGCL